MFEVIVTYVMCGLLGLCVGSFLNVVIYRVPNGMSLAKPSSHCPNCGYVLKWYDNIPVLSYLILGGKCRGCKQHISFRYTLVELLNTALWLLCAWQFGSNIFYLIVACLFCSVLICVTFIDIEHQYIYDVFQWILLALAVCALFADWNGIVWWHRLIGGGVGFAFFFIFYGVAYLIYKQEAMGFGDVLLAGVCGLFLGWKNFIVSVIVASLVGSVTLLVLRAKRKDDKKTEYPFAPVIALGAAVALFFGDYIVSAYTSLIGLGA